MKDSTQAAPLSAPNVTPMIDVLLVLLIVFMMLVPMLRRAIDLQLPEPATRDANDAAIVLEVGAGGTFAINRRPVPAGRLAEELRAIYDARPTKVLLVRGDRAARYQEVVRAMDVARGAGVRVIGVAPGGARDR